MLSSGMCSFDIVFRHSDHIVILNAVAAYVPHSSYGVLCKLVSIPVFVVVCVHFQFLYIFSWGSTWKSRTV